MPYVQDVQDDVFISYAHIDNQPLAEGQRGWISDLHRALQVRLAQLLGEEPSLWRDPKLQGNDYLTDALLSRLPKIATLVSVLSPRYLRSEWCLKELRGFLTAAEERHRDKSRVFKVVKTPVPRDEHPAELQELLGYDFYWMDDATGHPREFLPEGNDDARRRFFDKLEDLAYDIHKMLKTLRASAAGRAVLAPGPVEAPVYLAETTSELAPDRDLIRRELAQRGIVVRPERPLPLRAKDLEAAVRADLERARLSVHLVGRDYGIVPEGTDRSLVSIQAELAGEVARSGNLRRVFWHPGGAPPDDERQKGVLRRLREETSGEPAVDLLEQGIEELKSLIRDRLVENPARPVRTAAKRTVRRVYLICDAGDLPSVASVEDFLYGRGYETVRPAMEGDESARREDHKENLLACDAALIYYGSGGELWLRTKLRDFDKVFGYGRTAPMLAKGVWLADPETAHKKSYRTHEALVMAAFGAFRAEALAPFLSELEGA